MWTICTIGCLIAGYRFYASYFIISESSIITRQQRLDPSVTLSIFLALLLLVPLDLLPFNLEPGCVIFASPLGATRARSVELRAGLPVAPDMRDHDLVRRRATVVFRDP